MADFLRISPWQAQDVRIALRQNQLQWLIAAAERRHVAKVIRISLDDSIDQKHKETRHLRSQIQSHAQRQLFRAKISRRGPVIGTRPPAMAKTPAFDSVLSHFRQCPVHYLGGDAMSTLTRKPVQVYLRQEQLDALKVRASRQGVSVAELVRLGVDRILNDVPLDQDPIWDIVGLGSSDVDDLAKEHDRYLAEIEESDNQPRHG